VNHAEPYLERDYTGLHSNEIWDSDHHQFDVVVNAGGKLCRPWLTAWQDLRSRMIVGWTIRAEDPNTEAILVAFRSAVLAWGVPETVYHDNGKDYDSYALHGRTKRDRWERRRLKLPLEVERSAGVFAGLGITAHWAGRTTGRASRSSGGSGRSSSTRRAGRPTAATRRRTSPRTCSSSSSAATPRRWRRSWPGSRDWLDAGYHRQPHTGQGMEGKTPAAVYHECRAVVRTAPAELLDVLLLKPTQPIAVTQNGVQWQGIRYGQYEPSLLALRGQEVTLRIDDRDVSRVSVWTAEGRFVCVAQANARVPANATAEELREAIKSKKQDRKLSRSSHAGGRGWPRTCPTGLVRAKALRASTQQPGGETRACRRRSIQPVRSPLEDEFAALQAALKREPLRPAVGAECESLADVGKLLRGQSGRQAAEAPAPPRDEFADLGAIFRRGGPTEGR
jgi:putative transposase